MLPLRSCLLSSGIAMALLLSACKAQTPAETVSAEPVAPQAASQQPVAPTVSELPPPAMEPAAQMSAPAVTASTGAGWQYQTQPHQYGELARAELVSASGSERLVFENHPVTGRGAHIELPTDVECPTGCKVMISRDGAPMTEVLASRPENPNIRLNLDEPRALWNSLRGVGAVKIEYPAKSGPVTAEFATAGLDTSKLPGWEE